MSDCPWDEASDALRLSVGTLQWHWHDAQNGSSGLHSRPEGWLRMLVNGLRDLKAKSSLDDRLDFLLLAAAAVLRSRA